MASNANPAPHGNDADSSAMRVEIAQKWGKFDEAEIASIKSNNDLVTKVASKYGLEPKQAQKEVEALAKGRQL